jgi:diaminopimelate decarboxylase
MLDFVYKGGRLYCEDVALERIADEVGTPFYCYSHATLVRHWKAFDDAFAPVDHLICFAAKANSNLAVLTLFISMGGGVDIVSGGELYRALKAGADPEKIVFAGVGKNRSEIAEALEAGVLMFNVESQQELEAVDQVAGQMGLKAPVALRVNPDVDPATHPYISTGLKQSKFGIAFSEAPEACRKADSMDNLEVVGLHSHIGSQITQASPFVDALERLVGLVEKLQAEGIRIRYLDLGGGLGITYKDEAPPHPRELAEALLPAMAGLDVTFIFEPGRVIVGNAGALVSRVLYTKAQEEKDFVVVDAAMNDLARPSLYGAYQAIWPLAEVNADAPRTPVDVVGPICESGDFLAKDRPLPALEPGDLLAVMSAGAYGFTMASNYNSRPRVAEVLVKGSDYYVVRLRETYEDLVRGETIPDFLL